MAKVFPGRYTVSAGHDFVVFVIGMRVNQWWKFHKWIPIAFSMPMMLRKLRSDKSLGLLAAEHFVRPFPLTTTMISYWRSFEDLERFARDPNLPHAPAWKAFMKNVGNTGSVGVYHETYQVHKGSYECLYGNMPRFGLAKAIGHKAVSEATDRASLRLKRPSD